MGNKKAKNLIIIVLIMLLLGCLGVVIWQYLQIKNNTVDNNDITDTTNNIQIEQENIDKENSEVSQEISKPQEKYENDEVVKSFEEKFLDYYTDIIIEGAKNGTLLKDVTGYVDAERLTEQEAIKNKNEYKKIIEKNLSNKEIFSQKFERSGKQCIVFAIHKMLNVLGLSTHNNSGMGSIDINGMQLYTEGDNAKINNEDTVFEEFGYGIDDVIEKVYNRIKGYAQKGILLNDTEGNVTADTITVKNVEENKQKIKDVLKVYLKGRLSVKEWKNNTLEITYSMVDLLQELGWSSHMNSGLGTNREGYITEKI